MSTFIITDQHVYTSNTNLTPYLKGLSLAGSKAAVGDTKLGNNTERFAPGLESIEYGFMGNFDGTNFEEWVDAFYESTTFPPTTVAVVDGSDGSLCYMFRGSVFNVERSGSIGEMFALNHSGAPAADKLIRGQILIPVADYTATADGTGQQLGAVTAAQKIYASLHVFYATGTSPTLDCILESDDNAGFSSATTRHTFTQATGSTVEWASVDGAITDDYWRIGYTIGGSDTPTFNFAVSVGIR